MCWIDLPPQLATIMYICGPAASSLIHILTCYLKWTSENSVLIMMPTAALLCLFLACLANAAPSCSSWTWGRQRRLNCKGCQVPLRCTECWDGGAKESESGCTKSGQIPGLWLLQQKEMAITILKTSSRTRSLDQNLHENQADEQQVNNLALDGYLYYYHHIQYIRNELGGMWDHEAYTMAEEYHLTLFSFSK